MNKHLIAGIIIVFLFSCSPEVESKPRPNILFAISDDTSFPHKSAYGTEWVQTPAFDRVAEEGVLFNRAYVPNPKCAPSRSIILTGRNSWQLEEAANHGPFFPQKFKVFPEVLDEHGYFVGSTGKGWGPGLAETSEGEQRYLAGKPYDEHRADPPTSEMSNIDYATNFNAFLEDRPTDMPFYFWYGAREPHRGYEYRSGIEKGGKALSDIDEVPYFWPDHEVIRTDLLDYAFAVEHFDNHLVRMLKMLEERGELENTIVVVTSDHGKPSPRIKGQIYEMSIHVPMAIMWPEGLEAPGRVVEDYVSFVDIAPTFIELAGLQWEETGMYPTPGRSLTDIIQSNEDGWVNPEERDHVLVGKERQDLGRPYAWGYPVRGIVRDDMLYVRNFEPTRWPAGNPETGYTNTDVSPIKTFILDNRTTQGMHHFWQWNFGKRPAEEMYNVAEDPYCIHNLADDPSYQNTKNKLKAELFERLKEQEDPRMFGRGYVFEAYPHFNENRQGLYNSFFEGEDNTIDTGRSIDHDAEWLPEQKQ